LFGKAIARKQKREREGCRAKKGGKKGTQCRTKLEKSKKKKKGRTCSGHKPKKKGVSQFFLWKRKEKPWRKKKGERGLFPFSGRGEGRGSFFSEQEGKIVARGEKRKRGFHPMTWGEKRATRTQ